MNRITWDYYDVWYRKRRCQVLIPEDISQIWITQYSGMGQGGMDFDFWGNRKGLESVRDACAALSEKDNLIVYLPCKNNSHLFLQNYCLMDLYTYEYKFVDFVFMKPGTVKIDDWRQIRNRICKMKGRKWSYCFQNESENVHQKDKYEYRRDIPQLYYLYDTIFLNFFSFKYAELVSDMDSFLESDLENIFLEDMIRNDHRLRGENYLWFYEYGCEGWKKGFKSGVFFWDDVIYQMERQRKQK